MILKIKTILQIFFSQKELVHVCKNKKLSLNRKKVIKRVLSLLPSPNIRPKLNIYKLV